MFEKRLTNSYKAIPADFIAGEKMSVGMFVKVDYATKTLTKAATAAEVQGIVVRGSKVSVRNALGLPESIFDEFQNTIEKGEKVGLFVFEAGERFATDVVEATLKTALDKEETIDEKRTALIGKELTVAAGVLKEAVGGDTVVAILYRVDAEGYNSRITNPISNLLNGVATDVTGLYDLSKKHVLSFACVKPYTK